MHKKKHHHGGKSSPKKSLHKDWKTWLGVLCMLAAIAAYVLTLDDSHRPIYDEQDSSERLD